MWNPVAKTTSMLATIFCTIPLLRDAFGNERNLSSNQKVKLRQHELGGKAIMFKVDVYKHFKTVSIMFRDALERHQTYSK